MKLSDADFNTSYTISNVNTNQKEIKDFLLTLGCYPGEEITIMSKLSSNYIVNIKNARYSIDENLASTILI